MIVTDIEIKDFLYAFLKDSGLGLDLSGSIYKDARPLNSELEDVVISVLARDAEQVQSITANVNVYVPDVKRGAEFIEDTKRLRDLCRRTASLFGETVSGKFIFRLEWQMVMDAGNVDFHIINNRVRIQAFTEDVTNNV